MANIFVHFVFTMTDESAIWNACLFPRVCGYLHVLFSFLNVLEIIVVKIVLLTYWIIAIRIFIIPQFFVHYRSDCT